MLRLSSIEQMERKRNEYAMMCKAFENRIRVSAPYTFGVTTEGIVYQLTEWLDGNDLETVLSTCSVADRYALGKKTAKYLKQIHALSASDAATSWKERFYQKILVRLEEAQQFTSKTKFSAVKQYLLQNISVLDACTQCFNHGDFNPGNLILLKNGELAAVDFNCYNSGYGEPVFEAAVILLDETISADFRRGFEDAYFERWTDPDYKKLLNYYCIYDFLARLCETQDECEKTQLLKEIENLVF